MRDVAAKNTLYGNLPHKEPVSVKPFTVFYHSYSQPNIQKLPVAASFFVGEFLDPA